MSDRPKFVDIHEEGPREGFQIEKRPISTQDKIALIEALAETGLHEVQCVSFVNPKRVPGMADADAVVAGVRRKPDVRYSGIWLNLQGLERANRAGIFMSGELQISASETFSIRNANKDTATNLAEQRRWMKFYRVHDIALQSAIVMTAFGCNYEGSISVARVCDCIAMLMDVAAECDVTIPRLRLADTVGWGNPDTTARIIGAVRERWPDLPLGLHLHDTRGLGMANALVALNMGVAAFDSSCAGLGGCPFADHQGAAGNICTEDLVFMCEELGVETGLDLDRLIECARMAERIVGHTLPGKLMHAGSLSRFRH